MSVWVRFAMIGRRWCMRLMIEVRLRLFYDNMVRMIM
jgi:hypothetical protein